MVKVFKFELSKLLTSRKFYVIAFVILCFTLLMASGVKVMNGMDEFRGQLVTNGQSYPLLLLEQVINSLPIMLIVLLGGLFADEYRDGTLKLTLLRPISRGELMAAKVSVVAVATILYLFVTMLSGLAVGTALFGWGEQVIIPRTDIVWSTGEGFVKTLVAYGLTALPLMAFSFIVLALSIVMTNSAMVIGASMGVFFLLEVARSVLTVVHPYVINSHFLMGRVFALAPQAADLPQALMVVLAYAAVALVVGFNLFSRKDIVY